MTAPATIRDLVAPPVLDTIRDDLFDRVKNAAFPITDWHDGAVVRSVLEIDAIMLLDLVGAGESAEKLLAGGFADTASGPWLTETSRCLYERPRGASAVSFQQVTLACATGFGPYTHPVEAIRLANAAGQTYVNTTTGTLSGGGTLTLTLRAEAPGATLGLVDHLVDPARPGVTVQSAVTFESGSDPNHGFGLNVESDVALALADQAKWTDLDAIPIIDRMVEWALASAPAITRARLDVSAVDPGGVVITVAGAAGPVAGADVTAAQAYIDPRAPITDYPLVQNATGVNVSVTAGTVVVAAGQLAAAQTAADAAWAAFLALAPIGGVVPWAVLEDLLMDQPGVRDVFGLQLNGGAVESGVVLGPDQVPVKVGVLSSQLTWVPV